MLNNTYKNAFTEVYTILSYLDDESYFKIPENIVNVIKKNQNLEYNFYIDESIPFPEQKLLKETKAILFNLYRDYLIDEKDKKILLNYQNKKILELENLKRQKYNPDDIFKKQNNYEDILSNSNVSSQNVLIEVKKTSIFQKLVNKIKKFLHVG